MTDDSKTTDQQIRVMRWMEYAAVMAGCGMVGLALRDVDASLQAVGMAGCILAMLGSRDSRQIGRGKR